MGNYGNDLTQKEMDILTCFALGMMREEVAERFGIKQKTLRHYLSVIFQKLNVKRLHQAVVWLFANEYNAKAKEPQRKA